MVYFSWTTVSLVAASSLLHAVPAQAQFDNGQQQVSQCILNFTGDTRSALALVKVRSACNDLYQSGSFADDRERKYDQCILQHIAGAQTDAAAQQIANACFNSTSSF